MGSARPPPSDVRRTLHRSCGILPAVLVGWSSYLTHCQSQMICSTDRVAHLRGLHYLARASRPGMSEPFVVRLGALHAPRFFSDGTGDRANTPRVGECS